MNKFKDFKKRFLGKWKQYLFFFFVVGGALPVILTFLLQIATKPNLPPIAKINASHKTGHLPKTIYFDANDSYDTEGSKLTYEWKINGKPVSKNNIFHHHFKKKGLYHVTLEIEDDHNLSNQASYFVKILPPIKTTSVKETLAHRKLKIGWIEPHSNIIKYYPIDVSFLKNGLIVARYKKSGGFKGLISETKKKFFGLWYDEDSHGEFELVFTPDFEEANGWWVSDRSDKRYKLHIKMI